MRRNRGISKDLATGGVKEEGGPLQAAIGFQHAQRSGGVALKGFLGLFKAHTWAALSGEMVDFVGLYGANQALQTRVVEDIEDMQKETYIINLRIPEVSA